MVNIFLKKKNNFLKEGKYIHSEDISSYEILLKDEKQMYFFFFLNIYKISIEIGYIKEIVWDYTGERFAISFSTSKNKENNNLIALYSVQLEPKIEFIPR